MPTDYWASKGLFSALQSLWNTSSPILSLLGVSGSMEHSCQYPPFRADISLYLDHFDHFYSIPPKIHDLRIVELKLYERSGVPADKRQYIVVTVQDLAGTIYHFRIQGRQMQLFGGPQALSANLNIPSEDPGRPSSESATPLVIVSIWTVRYPRKRLSDSLVGTLTLPTGDAALPFYWYQFVFLADTAQKSFHDNRLFKENHYGVAGALMMAMKIASNVAVDVRQGCTWDSLAEGEHTVEIERFNTEYNEAVGKFKGMLEVREGIHRVSEKFHAQVDVLRKNLDTVKEDMMPMAMDIAEIWSALREDAERFLEAMEKGVKMSCGGRPTARDVERIRAEVENLIRLTAL